MFSNVVLSINGFFSREHSRLENINVKNIGGGEKSGDERKINSRILKIEEHSREQHQRLDSRTSSEKRC